MKNNAFTLAEVLITLGIIGVVAAMTIPTLIQNYRKKVIESKLIKVYSLMNQAIKLSTIENGETSTWKTLGTSTNSTASYEDLLEWYNTYLADYLKVQKVEKVFLSDENIDCLALYLLDGTVLTFPPYIYDVRYYLNPKIIRTDSGQMGKNLFFFRFQPTLFEEMENRDEEFKYVTNPGFATYAYGWNGTIEGAKHSAFGNGCYDSGSVGGALCTKLIELNGWKIPEDYPF